MTALADHPIAAPRSLRARFLKLLARPEFQKWAARFPLTRGRVKRDGAELFELVQGFVSAQVLFAIVELEIIPKLLDGPSDAVALGQRTGVPPQAMQRLLQAGAALGLLKRRKDRSFDVTPTGAALTGVPGLQEMILHHGMFYRDLSDPVALLKGETTTELAEFWPYVHGAAQATDPALAQRYSRLMAQSQGLVAEDTLSTVRLSDVRHLMDVGGGTGAFAMAAARSAPGLRVTLLDLPAVVDAARDAIAQSDVANRIALHGGSFRDEPLPTGADAISLIRVLYDHTDETISALLARVFEALPSGGKLIVSEPMSGGSKPDRAGDVYFAFYTLAMNTGTVRSPERIGRLCTQAGFASVRSPKPDRPYVTRVLTAVKP